MSNEVQIVVTGSDRSGPAFDSADKGVKKLDDSVEGLNKTIGGLGETTADTSEDVKGLGGESDKASKSIFSLKDATTRLNAEIAATKQKIKELQQQRAMLGGGDEGSSLLGDIGKEENKLRSLKHLLEDLTSESVKAGGEAGRGFMGALNAAFEGTASTPILGPAIVAAVVTAAAEAAAVLGPLIGGIIAGGVTAAVGGGALAAGIFAATQDDSVQQAMSALSDQFVNEMKDIGKSFIEPVKDGLGILSKGLGDLDLAETFSKAAPAVERLAKGAVALAENAWPGINKALDESGPIFEAVEHGLGQVGEGLGDMIGELAESDGAVDGLRMLFSILKITLQATGATLGWLSDRFHETNRVMAVAYDIIGDITDLIGADDVAEGSRKAADGLRGFAADGTKALHGIGDAAKETLDPFARYLFEAAHNTEALTKSLQDLFGIQMSVDEATINYEESVDKLTEAVKENGKSIDAGTEKGRAVREALLGEIQAAIDLRDATIKKTGATEAANAQYVAQIELLKKQAVALGLSKAEIDKLVGNYVITLTTIYKTIGSKPKINPGNRSAASDEILGNAAGGIASGGNSGYTMVGEWGPELVKLPQGSMVYSAGQSQQMAGGMNGGGGGTTTLVLESDGSKTSDFLMEILREGIRVKTGGNVQRALGRNSRG